MAKKQIEIELNKNSSDIVSKTFKIGAPANKVAEDMFNGLINKLVFGNEEEAKNLLSLLVPDILSVDIAKKLYNNIQKYKLSEKNKLKTFIELLDDKNQKDETIKEISTGVEKQQNSNRAVADNL